VGAISGNPGGTKILERLGCGAQGAGSIDHIVDQDAVAVFHVTDDVHDFRLVGLGPTLVDDRQVCTQGFGHGTGANHATDIRGNDQQVVQALILDVINEYRRAVDVIHRDIEEALDLVGVQVNSQYAID